MIEKEIEVMASKVNKLSQSFSRMDSAEAAKNVLETVKAVKEICVFIEEYENIDAVLTESIEENRATLIGILGGIQLMVNVVRALPDFELPAVNNLHNLTSPILRISGVQRWFKNIFKWSTDGL